MESPRCVPAPSPGAGTFRAGLPGAAQANLGQKGDIQLKTSDFDFYLPEELIAQHPLERRDASRLMALDKNTGAVPLVGEEEHLTGSAPGQPVADEPGREHPGVVQHQAVPRPEELRQVVEVVVGDGPGVLVQCHQP